ncbi:MAG: sigma-70 family RNA polymerase sigma factor [Bacteroidales bacterium]|jgi:RNA polymerase sigma factor (sigma-70 family)|nr:sigma-70 family RNA polymerase sigma factor [Bacteroidales bacterium]
MAKKRASNENLEELIAEYQPGLRSFIRSRINNKEDTDDILQDVFYKFINTVQTALNPIEHASAWLYRVARNTIINHGTKKREVEMPVYTNSENDDDDLISDFSEILFGTDASSSPETEYLRSLVWEELENALAELPPEQRKIYELTEFCDIPVKEISQTTGVPVNTLLSRKHYAILHLRKKLRDLYYELVVK